MTIDFFVNESENNAINKKLTKIGSLSGTAREELEFTKNPTLLIQNVNDFNLLNSNYVFIEEFNRYYFVTNFKFVRNDLIELTVRIDVLMSFKNEILNLNVIAERSENLFSSYFVDNQKMAYNFPMVLTKKFSNGFDKLNYYLTVASGGREN